jgi:hypothetical protein
MVYMVLGGLQQNIGADYRKTLGSPSVLEVCC